ncbi:MULTISPECIES: DUF3300 domain-containing protein [unclassified Bradyrhizobium]|uniref:DUF3300 domain-containing protein n=1 Tax=unclassified Bradyrhizobium TaxID=2631580 RepID=UPI001BA543D7|nr:MULTISPECIES: DUF3300 domain-containing protein [unclassified Bradyrhizobium]MBR1227850.1 DUF3300 domain-containing protein [Bradyrhizobium sp. AUGA SZCCT0176]MBR1300576.1 DUF3300 domain-containing protein [Bradyrhizobium sp. AUGA SZCCT0042]
MFRCGKTLIALALLIANPVAVSAQTTDNPPAPSSSAQPTSQQPPSAELLKPEQLEALVAPIALYPDELLANVLAASTYPLEVVQADRWLKEHKILKGDALKKEVEKQSWDNSVKALTSTADVISMMSDKVDWTKNLGDAVLVQQPDVMDAIQRLRSKAYDNKKLVTTKQQKVSVQTQENKQAIVIEQADPNTMYVPYYDPATVYGAWPYAEYPPYYFGYPSYIGAGVIAAGLAFGTAWAIGRWGNYWGGGFNWGNRNVYVNHFNRTTNIGNNWQHNPAHRQGVRYNNANVQQRFGNNNLKAGASNRMDFRGRDGQQVLRPGQDRPGAGDRAGDRVGDRAGDRGGDRVGDRGGNRPSTADRAKAGGGDRAKAAKGGGDRAKAANRGGGGGRGSAMNVSSGRAAAAQSARGRASMASMGPHGGGPSFAGRGGGGAAFAGGGGGFRGGGGGGGFRGGGGGGGRRSDIELKHDVVLLGHLANGLGYYRFSYLGSSKPYVGVIAQEVQTVAPEAVTRGPDGYLRVRYEQLGLKLRSYTDWLGSGAKIPTPAEVLP